ncbi:TIGR04351 family putative TOMM peptide [Streptacidiphilus sp. PAMC 29251]
MNGTTVSHKLWLAELAARAGLEPRLADRYLTDAREVLAEIGVVLGADEQPPALLGGSADGLSIDTLDQRFSVSSGCNVCFCTADRDATQPQPEGQLVAA